MGLINIKKAQKLKYYKDYPIEAKIETHEKVSDIIKENKFSKNIEILVLGSGSGAFEARLQDMGFKNIYSCEFYKEKLKFKHYKQNYRIDLDNVNFSKLINKKFDLIIGIEIIEHLCSPFHFLQNCRKLLKKDAMLIFTTPYLHSFLSRILFLVRGYPFSFELPIKKTEHISPISENQIWYYLETLNFEKTTLHYNLFFTNNMQYRTNVKSLTLNMIGFLILKLLSKFNHKLNTHSLIVTTRNGELK